MSQWQRELADAGAGGALENQMKYFLCFVWVWGWIAGMVLANGFWSTGFAFWTGGLWSWYLVLEKLVHKFL